MEERQVGALRMKRIGRRISILMGFTLSLCLSLVANLFLAEDGFKIGAFFLSFAISLTISLIIGFIVPMKRVNDSVDRALKLRPGSMAANALESLISDLIYTPIITLVMTIVAWKMATSHNPNANIPYLPMFLKSLAVCMAVGYVLIFIFTPLYTRLVVGKRRMPAGPPKDRRPEGQQDKKQSN